MPQDKTGAIAILIGLTNDPRSGDRPGEVAPDDVIVDGTIITADDRG